MWCHLLLAMPVIALGFFLLLPLPVALPTYTAAVGFSMFLYRKVLQAMRQPPQSGWQTLIGREAVVVSDIVPEAQIPCHGEVWSAISQRRLVRGEKVRIVGFEGLKAIVESVER